MSNNFIDINKLYGKKVLFIDTETTGIPNRNYGNMPDFYHDYSDNSKYNKSRLVQVAYCYYDYFNKDFDIDINNINSIIRKPFNFNSIPQEAVNIHGITYDYAIKNGTLIKKILRGDFGKCLLKCDYFVAYNAYFDFSILANEIYRTNYDELYNKMIKLKDKRKVFCAMKLSSKYLGKCTSQENVYKRLYNKEPNNQHNAKNDVLTMLKIIKYITENPVPNENIVFADNTSNNGNVWTTKEIKQLKKLYLDDNKSIPEIATIHKRTKVAITLKLNKLNILNESDIFYKDKKKDKTNKHLY